MEFELSLLVQCEKHKERFGSNMINEEWNNIVSLEDCVLEFKVANLFPPCLILKCIKEVGVMKVICTVL
jgi:hypothetical protein